MSRNLLVATGIFHPEPGGPATYLYEILPALQDKGWDIRVLTYGDNHNHEYPYPIQRIQRGMLPVRIGRYGVASVRTRNWADMAYLHTIDLPLWGGGSTPRIIKIVGDQAWERCIRKGWIPPTEDIDDFQTKEYGLVTNWQKWSRSRQVCNLDAVIVPSEYLKRMVIGWGVPPEQIHVIYNALPPHSPKNITKEQARQQLDLPESPILLTAARLHPWKGVDHVIEAVKQIPEVHLIIAGDGPERHHLEQIAQPVKDRFHFLGQVSFEQMAVYRKAADYVVLYSGYEGLSHTLLESLRDGTPVIASDKGGNPEVVQHGINGLLAPYVNQEALTETIREAIQPSKYTILVKNTHVGMEKFSFERMVEQTHHVLTKYTK